MKKYIMILLFISLATISFGQEFMGIKVDGNINDVVEKFKQKGLKVITNINSIGVTMKGLVANKETELIIQNCPTSKIVWKFAVYLPEKTTWYSLKSEYQEYLDLLIKKYGEPKDKFDSFSSPYEEGDGYEMSAVSLEKCNYAAYWTKKDGLSIEISKWKQVKINYENPVNSALDTKEKDEIKNKIF